MMQGGSMHQDWRITTEDRAKHDNQFNQLKPVNGFITGDAARGFFMQSGLPQQVLGHIWTLSDMNSDGKLDKLEFSIAMYLIKKKLSGVELPRTLPASLKQAPSPAMPGFGVQPMGMVRPMAGFGTMPAGGMPAVGMPAAGMQPGSYNTLPNRPTPNLGGFGAGPAQQNAMARAGTVQASPERSRSSSITADWGVPHNSKLKFTQMFNTQDRTRSGFLTGAQARNVLVQSGLGQAHLAQIWGLADVDNDGRLTCDEFCLALHLVDIVKSGKPLPAKLPPDLVPPSYRRGRSSSLTSSGGGAPPTPAPAPAMPTPGMMASMGGLGQAPMGGAMPMVGAPMMGGGTMPGAMPGGMPGQGGFGAMGAPLSPVLAKQQSVDEQQQPQEEEKKFTPVSFEDRKRQNFEKGQQELERRRAALREVQEREKERQRELEKQEQERKERIRMEQERRRQLELERMMQKQREIEAEREAQRLKLEQQREAARRELERQRQMEIERQKRQELEAKRIKSQEEVCHLKATSKTLACEIETLEDKKNELNKKISESQNFVKEHQTSIILMGQNRDVKVAEIDQLQQRIQEVRQLKQQRAQQKEELQVQAKKLNINTQVSDTYAAVMTSYDNKQKTLVKLRAALEEVERKTAASLQDTDNGHAKLAEMKASLVREQNEIDQVQKQLKAKMADFTMMKKRLEDQKKLSLIKQNQQNEKIRQEAMQKKKEEEETKKKFDAIRLAQEQAEKEKAESEKRRKEEEEKKKEESTKKADPFAAFGSSDNDPFAAAFDSNEVTNADPNDPFAAFSGTGSVQSTKQDSEKKDPFGAFADFSNSNSTFDFGHPFKPQSSTTSSSATTTTTTTTSSASLATSFTPTPQPRTVTAPSTNATMKQPSPATSSQPSPLTIQPTVEAVVASQPEKKKEQAAVEPSSATDAMAKNKPTPLPKELKSVLSQYKALYQFDAEGPDELSIKPGDIILVGKNQGGEPGWLGGELNGKTGWFPENYAEKLPSPPPTPRKPENGVSVSKTDTPSWASFGDSKISTEVKQQSAPASATVSATTSLTSSSAPAFSSLTPSPAPDTASATKTSSPSPAPASQEPTTPNTTPVSESAPAPSRSVAALTAAFSAAAEASAVPQVSKPKPIETKPTEEVKASSFPDQAATKDDPVYDVIGESDSKVKAVDSQSSFTKVVPQTGATPSPVPNQGTIPPAGTKVKALYDWDAKKDNHLSFKAGEMITVLEKQDMWWLGEMDGRRGWFPKAHVQFLEESVPEGSKHNFQNSMDNNAIYANTPKPQPEEPFALYANTPKVTKQPSPPPSSVQQQMQQAPAVAAPVVATQENSVPPQRDGQKEGEECVALYTYTSDEPSDLTFEAGERITVTKKEGEWWTGKVGEREGIFPSNYVQMAQPEGGTSSSGQSLAPVVPADVAAKSGSLSKKPEIARVLASYEATGAEQLSLTAGQLIMVRKKNASGWWEGELQARGKKRQIGWFPANYVKLMESSAGGKSTPSETSKSPSILTPPSQANQRLTPGIDMVCQVITIYPYTQQNDDELSFQKGMVINVLSKEDPDWWRGELNGTEGVFPSNYVQELGDSKSAPSTD